MGVVKSRLDQKKIQKRNNTLLSDGTAIAASLAKASKSAPTNPWVISASFSKSTSSVNGIPLV
jgi:hypothetical protein